MTSPAPFSPPPFRAPRFAPPRNDGQKVALIIAGVVLLFGIGLVALAGGVVVWGMGIVTDQVEADLRGNPVLQAHLGTITRFDLNYVRSMAEPDTETFVFDVTGAKGSGRIVARCVTVDADHEKVTAGKLQLASGQEYDLFPSRPPKAPDER
jgi:hypothetical protein